MLRRESTLVQSLQSLTVGAPAAIVSSLLSSASPHSTTSPRNAAGVSSPFGGGDDDDDYIDDEDLLYAEDLLPEDLWERILLFTVGSLKDLCRLSCISRSIRKQVWGGAHAYVFKARVISDHFRRLEAAAATQQRYTGRYSSSLSSAAATPRRQSLSATLYSTLVRPTSLLMGAVGAGSLLPALTEGGGVSASAPGELALPAPVFYLPDATRLVTAAAHAGVVSPPAHPSALRLAVESGNMDLVRTFVLQLGYAATPDLVPLALRTCGAPRTQREALLLLLSSMVNADEPVDAASFHAHVTANSDVERVFVDGLGVAPTWVRKGYLRDRFAATLMAAAAHEDLVAVARLLARRGCGLDDVPAGNFHGWGPLAVACARGSTAMVKFLLGAAAAGSAGGAPLQAERADLLAGFTPLHLAAAFGHLECVEALLEHGIAADVGRRPLTAAARARAVTSEAEAEIRRVVDALELPGWYLWPRDRGPAGGAGMTPLDEATLRNQPHVVAALVRRGASLARRTHAGKSLLYLAAGDHGFVAVARALLACGAWELERAGGTDVAADVGGETSASSSFAVLDAHASPPEREGFTALHRAAQLAHIGAVALLAPLYAATGWPEPRDGLGCTPLHAACARPRQLAAVDPARLRAVVETLLEHGADPAAEDGVGRTPLDLTSSDEVKEVLRQALEKRNAS